MLGSMGCPYACGGVNASEILDMPDDEFDEYEGRMMNEEDDRRWVENWWSVYGSIVIAVDKAYYGMKVELNPGHKDCQ